MTSAALATSAEAISCSLGKDAEVTQRKWIEFRFFLTARSNPVDIFLGDVLIKNAVHALV
jgi:hypothetical protein